MPPASAPSPSGVRRTPCWARRWGQNVQWDMKAWSRNRRRGDLPMQQVRPILTELHSLLGHFQNRCPSVQGGTSIVLYALWTINIQLTKTELGMDFTIVVPRLKDHSKVPQSAWKIPQGKSASWTFQNACELLMPWWQRSGTDDETADITFWL